MPIDDQRRELAQRLCAQLAQPGSLTPNQARLFSQAVRIGWGGDALPVWTPERRAEQWADTRRLLECAALLVELGDEDGARVVWRRAGDILEWLARSRPAQLPAEERSIPLALLGAAAFHLAQLPAMAAGLLAAPPRGGPAGDILAAFFRADFAAVVDAAVDFWRQHAALTRPAAEIVYDLETPEVLATELVRCIGLIAAMLRTNQQPRLQAALSKLRALARLATRARSEYLWLVVELTAQVAERFAAQSLWTGVESLQGRLSEQGRARLTRFAQAMFGANRGLLWPSQREGIARLAHGGSFALCTPTGSGKTAVAELALVDALYSLDGPEAPLAIYLVPSRALAAEVEARLAHDLGGPGSQLTVTGLYGGTEWSLADAWVTATNPTVLVCTVEMAEALLRYVGPLLLPRMALLVMDEAHQVQFLPSSRNSENLRQAEHRGARLEQFVSRIFACVPRCRALALSAVAGGIETSIARWFSRGTENEAIGRAYRSTRQLIGALECRADGGVRVRLERLDGRNLKLVGRDDAAYVPLPFARMPAVTGVFRADVGRFARAHALWAAMQTARAGRTVLVSVTRDIEAVTADFRALLETQRAWRDVDKNFVQDPTVALYAAALAACEDYSGPNSNELFLLRLGIAVHHGQLPILVRRLMTEVIRARVVPITVATSTLTEGVNLPFDVVLVPSIVRKQFDGLDAQGNARYSWPVLPAAEFLNLAGRVGRPGTMGEGMTLVTLPVEPTAGRGTQQATKQVRDIGMHADRFDTLLADIERSAAAGAHPDSPLARLLTMLHELWRQTSPNGTHLEFLVWLEEANRPDAPPPAPGATTELAEALDSLDLVLLAAITEAEGLRNAALTPAELEAHLQQVWSSTFARFAVNEQEQLGRYFLRRGLALPSLIYPSGTVRRELYRLGLPPRQGTGFLQLVGQIEAMLHGLDQFPVWDAQARFEFIQRLAGLVQQTPGFRFRVQADEPWATILQWWMQVPGARPPEAEEVQTWLRMATVDFEYRLGTAIGMAMAAIWTRVSGQQVAVPDLDEWQARSGLAWSALWLREMLAWGTLEPLVAFLVATRREPTRAAAAARVPAYAEWFRARYPTPIDDEIYHPLRMRRWASAAYPNAPAPAAGPTALPAAIEGRFPADTEEYPVVSLSRETGLDWLDPAGYVLARTDRARAGDVSGDHLRGVLRWQSNRVALTDW